MTESQLLTTARRLADDVLFAHAIETDAAPLLPAASLEALAEAGLYGLAGPPSAGRPALANMNEFGLVAEALAGGCLTTAFVWIQHHRGVRGVGDTTNAVLRDRYLEDMCAGRVRAGVVFGGTREPPQVRATRVDGGWQLDGVAPWVTGWGRIDILYAMTRSADGNVVSVLLDAREGGGLSVRPLHLVAANASGTVEVTFDRVFAPEERVVSVEPYVPAPPYDGGGRPNGSLALGVAGRCLRLIGSTALDGQLAACRDALDTATDETMAAARAEAAALAWRAAGMLAVHRGSSSLLLDQHPQRLAREALFLLNFGTRPAIRDRLLARFGAD